MNAKFPLNACLQFTAPIAEARISPFNTFQVGDSHTFMCTVYGADNLIPDITYEWERKDNNQVKSNSRTFSLVTLRLSDAGSYTCKVTIASDYLHRSIANSTTVNVTIKSKCTFVFPLARFHIMIHFIQCPVQLVFQLKVSLVDYSLFLRESQPTHH